MGREVAERVAAQNSDRSSVSSLAFLVWDILITFDDEVECMWSERWTWIKALYLFIRYFALATQVSLLFLSSEPSYQYTPQACFIWNIFQVAALQALITSVEAVLMLRVKALYAYNRRIINTLYVLFVAEVIAMTVSTVITVRGLKFDEECVITESPDEIMIYGFASITFEFTLFTLTGIKFVQALREGWGNTSVMQLLIRDGTWVFALIFITMLFNAICFIAVSGEYSGLGFTWLITVLAFSGSRLMLNMHQLGKSKQNECHSSPKMDSAYWDTHLDFEIGSGRVCVCECALASECGHGFGVEGCTHPRMHPRVCGCSRSRAYTGNTASHSSASRWDETEASTSMNSTRDPRFLDSRPSKQSHVYSDTERLGGLGLARWEKRRQRDDAMELVDLKLGSSSSNSNNTNYDGTRRDLRSPLSWNGSDATR